MKGNLKRPDFRELMNPLLRTTAGILFFSRESFMSGSVSENRGRKNDGN